MKLRELVKAIKVNNSLNGINRYPSTTTFTEQSKL
jgi:hypothetical protein